MAPPVTAGPANDPGVRGLDSVDAWLASIEDKAASVAKAAARSETEDPAAWRERWTPTDAVREPEKERRLRYRIRFGAGQHSTGERAAQVGSRQFVAVLLTIIALVLLGLAGPSVVRGSVRFVRFINEQFSPPPPPPLSASPATRVTMPRAPQVPPGPY
jgi:hypothetical protein